MLASKHTAMKKIVITFTIWIIGFKSELNISLIVR